MREKTIAAGMMIVCPETNSQLLLKRKKTSDYANYWTSPGGTFDEEDGNPKATALREFIEETGYKGKISISSKPIVIENSNLIDFYLYLCVVPGEFIPNLSGECFCGQEHQDYAWFDLNFMPDNLMSSNVEALTVKRKVVDIVIDKYKKETL